MKGLVGLYWSAPYLHDGGVAVGPGTEVGMPQTLLVAKLPDPYQSLRALLDRGLRQRVIESNRAHPALVTVGVVGIGHEFWIDSDAGFTNAEQRAAVLYLLTYQPPGRCSSKGAGLTRDRVGPVVAAVEPAGGVAARGLPSPR